MNRARPLLSLGLAAVLAGVPKLSLSGEEKLQHDPFARPALAGLQHASRPAPGRNGAAAGLTRILKLQAVMVAGPNSIANVDGKMVRLGDEVHGYRLVEVHERTAVFEKAKTRFTVSIRGEAAQTPDTGQDRDGAPMRGPAQASSAPPDKGSVPQDGGTQRAEGGGERR